MTLMLSSFLPRLEAHRRDPSPAPPPLSPPPPYFFDVLLGFSARERATASSVSDYLGEPIEAACTLKSMRAFVITFVRNEIDIVASWIHYHGSLFGYGSLHVIDNNSTDGTSEVIAILSRQHGFNFTRTDATQGYGSKPEVQRQAFVDASESATRLNLRPYNWFIPLDVDEFLAVGLLNGSASVGKVDAVSASEVCSQLDEIGMPGFGLKTRYIDAFPADAAQLREATSGRIDFGIFRSGAVGFGDAVWPWTQDQAKNGKTFLSAHRALDPKFAARVMDHGNHMPLLADSASRSAFVLVHYHARSLRQLIKKSVANWGGFGRVIDEEHIEHEANAGAGGHYRQAVLSLVRGKPEDLLKGLRQGSQWPVSLRPLTEALHKPLQLRPPPPPHPPPPFPPHPPPPPPPMPPPTMLALMKSRLRLFG